MAINPVRTSSTPASNTPTKFEQVISQTKTLIKHVGDKAKGAAGAPDFHAYERIEVVEENKRLAYTTRDGKEVTVDKAQSPKLYKAVLSDYRTREMMNAGFTLSLDNADQLALLDYNDPSKVDRRYAHEGVITFEFGANKIVINERLTPDTFKRFSTLKDAQRFKEAGNLINPSQKLPFATTDYKQIRPLQDGIFLAETTAGEKYVVSRDLTPSQFAQLESIGKAKSALGDAKSNGYQVVTEMPKDLDPHKLQIDAVDNDNGVIRFQYDGKRYATSLVDALDWEHAHAEDLGPQPGIYMDGWIRLPEVSDTMGGGKLYSALLDFDAITGTPAEQAFKEAYDKDQRVVDDAQPIPRLAQIEHIEQVAEGVLQVKWGRGDTQIVLEATAPESYKEYTRMQRTLEGIKAAEGEGFHLVGNDDYLSSLEDVKSIGKSDQYGPGLITYVFQKPGAEEQKFVVSADYNPELHAQLLEEGARRNTPEDLVNELRAQHHIPADNEFSVDGLPTTVKDEKGEALSVQDLQFKLMYDEYKAGIKSGSIGKDDPRAKFMRALEAKSRIENGMPIVPHGSVDTIFVMPGEPMWLESRDVRDSIFDAKSVDEALAKGLNDPKVQEDLQRFQTDARSQVEGGEECIKATEQRLETLAGSDDFRHYLESLREAGHGDLAELEVQKVYFALAQIDPQKADTFLSDLSRDGLIMELDKIMADPGSVDPDNAALAGADVTNFVLRGMRAVGDMPAHLINAYETTFQKIYQNKATAADIDQVWRELGEIAHKKGTVTDADIQRALAKTSTLGDNAFSPLSATEKGNVVGFFANLKDAGVLGSVSGSMGLMRGIYQLVGNPGNLAATAEGRLVIASDFVTFLSFSNGFTTLGSKTYDKLFNSSVNAKLGLGTPIPDLLWGKDPNVAPSLDAQNARLSEMLDRTFNEVSTQFDPDPISNRPPTAPPIDETAEIQEVPREVNRPVRDTFRDLPFDMDYKPGTPPSATPLTQRQRENIARGLINGRGAKYSVSSSVGYRIAGSVSRFLGAGGDFAGGIIGIVLGAFGLRDSIKSGDKLQIASSSVGIVGGLGSTVGGLGSVGSALGVTGTLGRVLSFGGPVGFIVGATMGFVGAFISIARSEQLKKMAQSDWRDIEAFKEDGLLQPNGDEAYTWVQKYMHNWGQRDAPKDQSIFDFRSDEWERRETRRTLDHENYEGDGDNAWQTEFPEPSAGNFVQ